MQNNNPRVASIDKIYWTERVIKNAIRKNTLSNYWNYHKLLN